MREGSTFQKVNVEDQSRSAIGPAWKERIRVLACDAASHASRALFRVVWFGLLTNCSRQLLRSRHFWLISCQPGASTFEASSSSMRSLEKVPGAADWAKTDCSMAMPKIKKRTATRARIDDIKVIGETRAMHRGRFWSKCGMSRGCSLPRRHAKESLRRDFSRGRRE